MFPVAFAPHNVCMYVCMYVMLFLVYAFCLGSGGIRRYTPTAVYLTFRFICGYRGSAFLSVVGGSVSGMFSNSVKRTRGACQPDSKSQLCPCLNESILTAEFLTITLSPPHYCKPVASAPVSIR